MDGSRVDWRRMGLGHVVDAMGGGVDDPDPTEAEVDPTDRAVVA